jgi:hypothetical protein
VFVVRTIAWNVKSDIKDEKDLKQYKNGSKGKIPGQATKKNPDGGEIFRTLPDRNWGPPSLLYNGYRVSFP